MIQQMGWLLTFEQTASAHGADGKPLLLTWQSWRILAARAASFNAALSTAPAQ
jgi:hypothetical protein